MAIKIIEIIGVAAALCTAVAAGLVLYVISIIFIAALTAAFGG